MMRRVMRRIYRAALAVFGVFWIAAASSLMAEECAKMAWPWLAYAANIAAGLSLAGTWLFAVLSEEIS